MEHNLNITRIDRHQSCNFCKRGRINTFGTNLIYPYDHVYEVKGIKGGVVVSICPDCLSELTARAGMMEL